MRVAVTGCLGYIEFVSGRPRWYLELSETTKLAQPLLKSEYGSHFSNLVHSEVLTIN